jgi:predicted PolB exonuclease-like 3'-5' exonuclease
MADKQYNKVAPSFCGHNIKNFDLPFIIKRAMHHGIAIPNRLKAYGKKPWDLEHFIDLFDAYKYLSFSGKGSLDLICNFLNIPTPKQGIDGSQVQEYHDEGKDAEILEYCKRDVEATIAVYDKFVELNLI